MTRLRLHRSVHPLNHAVAWLAVATLTLAACSTGEDGAAADAGPLASTTAPPATNAEPTATDLAPASSSAPSAITGPAAPTTPATTEAATITQPTTELLVFEGEYVNEGDAFRELAGVDGAVAFVLSGSLSGELTGQRAIVGTFTTDGTEGSAVLVLNSPEIGEGVLASQFKGVNTSDELTVTGDLIGLSGAFADLVGTITTTGSPGPGSTGTYRIELEPTQPSPRSSAATETMPFEYVSTSTADLAWRSSTTSFGGASTVTGDVVGSNSIRSNDADGLDDLSIVHICACALGAEGDGVFIARLRSGVETGEEFAWEAEFFGVSGAFAGLRGVGTATTTSTLDATGVGDGRKLRVVAGRKLRGVCRS
jgi:hypothetical protein